MADAQSSRPATQSAETPEVVRGPFGLLSTPVAVATALVLTIIIMTLIAIGLDVLFIAIAG